MRQGEDDKRVPPLSASERAVLVATPDEKSADEAKQLSSGLSPEELRRRAETNEARRTEWFRDRFEELAVLTLYLVWFVLVVIGMTWAYHLVAPPVWPRLPDDQVRQLGGIVTGGILAGIAGGHIKRRLK